MQRLMTWFALLMLVVMTGCVERLDHFHRGNKVIERHYIPGDWSIPGDVSKTECRPDQMEWSTFWGKKVCPDTIENNAPMAVERGSVQTASYKDLVVPAAIQGAFFMGGMAILGTQINSGLQNQPQAQGALAGSSISTLNVRGTGPAFAGMRPAPLGGLR